jgi:beta-1,4-mannosyltransferase
MRTIPFHRCTLAVVYGPHPGRHCYENGGLRAGDEETTVPVGPRSPEPGGGRGLVVLQSFPAPKPTTNPYLVLLAESLRAVPGVTVKTFAWRTALFGRYDVFHTHWPEILVTGHGPVKTLAKQVLTAALIARLWVTRTPLVRTVHNVGEPEGLSRVQRMLLERLERRTTLRIRLNPTTDIPSGPFVTIPHGHYRDWFARYPARESVPGQLGYFGLIRRYKGVEGLLTAFRGLGSAGLALGALSLRIGGHPSSTELAEAVRGLAADDPRIALRLTFLSDGEVVELVTSSELVVLPYRFMHNSGGAFAALSLDRPVLLPDNAVNRLLAEEVGPGWVRLYAGELTGDALVAALSELRAGRPGGRPDLGARDWKRAGADHVAAYRRAIAEAKGG